jgi:hypothetical protein
MGVRSLEWLKQNFQKWTFPLLGSGHFPQNHHEPVRPNTGCNDYLRLNGYFFNLRDGPVPAKRSVALPQTQLTMNDRFVISKRGHRSFVPDG